MHVLVIPSSYPTSDNPARGCFYREQAIALRRHGLQVGVIAPMFRSLRQLFGRGRRRTMGFRALDDEGVATLLRERWARFSQTPRMHLRDWIRSGGQLFARYVERHGLPDVIHAHGSLLAGPLAKAIRQRTGVPYVITEHNTAFSRNAIRPWQDCRVTDVLANAATRIAVSPALGKLLEDRYGDAARPWLWIPNVVSQSFKPATLPVRESSKRARFRFLNVALISSNKGQDTLLHAMSKLVRAGAEVELRVVGDGVLRTSLTRLADKLGISSCVTFLGTLDRGSVVEEMQSADAFVLSSRHETFGVVLIEALACGLPVIATTCGGPECIVGPDDGLLVPPNDVSALASAMEQLMVQRSTYSAAQLRERCLARFDEKAVTTQLADVYAQVVTAQRRAGMEQAA
jgi:teichuronic acid biosynthesis glycosyltransferase TuaC